MSRHLGQGLGRCHPHRYGNAGTTLHGGGHTPGILSQRLIGADAREVEKSLVDGVGHTVGRKLGKERHDTAAHVAVEIVIAAENLHVATLQKAANLIQGGTHLDAHGLHLVAPGHHTTVVVGENDNRLVAQGGSKHPLARDEEIVAVDQGYHTKG